MFNNFSYRKQPIVSPQAFFAITVTASVMGQTATSAQAMAAARTAGHVVLDIIDRVSWEDSTIIINKHLFPTMCE